MARATCTVQLQVTARQVYPYGADLRAYYDVVENYAAVHALQHAHWLCATYSAFPGTVNS